MSRSKRLLALAFLAILSLSSAHPQSPATVPESPSAPAGSVTGFVYDGETRLPVRFAEINIVPIPSKADMASAKNQSIPPGVPQQRDRHVQRVYGISGMDGRFRLDVPEGNYLVAAVKPGYITPGAAAAMDFSLSEDQLESLIASLPQVHVGAGQAAGVSLTLHRGAVIAGRMQFADGSPVIGAMVGCDSMDSVLRLERTLRPENRGKIVSPRQEALQSLSSSQQVTQRALTTDAEGRYRIFGLPPGTYIVSTMIAMDHGSERVVMSDGSNAQTVGREHMYPEMIPVYAPATFRRKNAKVFEIRGDERIVDADLTIDPNGLHTLRGRVLAADDHHAPPTMIRLKEEGAKDVPRFVETEDDGSFQVNYLPSGRYSLQITSNDITDAANSTMRPTEYKMVELTAVIADQDVLLANVLLVRLKPGENNRFDLLF